MPRSVTRLPVVFAECEKHPEHYSCVGCPLETECFENVALGIGESPASEAKGDQASPVSLRR